MAKRYDLITELYAEAIREVTAKPENWLAFLRSACRNFRLPFDEQLLVYVQRPDAAAVLEMEDWNRKFGRWVKRDSKSIAVFDKDSGAMRLKHYFDVSDTQEGKYRRLVRPVPLWTVEERHRQAVQETLANAFGVSEETDGLAETILEAAKNAAEDNLADYMPDILSFRQDSFLEELDELNVEVEVRNLLSGSIAYMVMIRCGIEPETYLDIEDFRNITDFNTPEVVNLFGVATSDVAEMALSEISDTVRKLQKEEKNKNRTFAGQDTDRYNESKKTGIISERGMEDERDQLQQAGRLSVTESDRHRRTGSTHWEVRLTPQEIPERAEIRDIPEPLDTREAEPASDENAGGGTEQSGADRVGDGESTGRDRGAESERPDDVGTEDEQHPAGGGGDHAGGAGVRLEWYDRSREDKSLPFFGDDETINALLLTTPHLKATKEEIREFYESHEDKGERTEYIKSIFNPDYTEVILEDGRRVGYKTYQNVLHMWEGSYLSRTAQSYYDWGVIAAHFEGLRLLRRLRDKMKPLPTVDGQLTFLEELAEEKTSAFSFTQEIIDYALTGGSGIEAGKYRIYSYFLQGHSAKEKADFLKNEYGMGGRSSILSGTGIGEDHDAKGLKFHRGYREDSPELLLKWPQVAKRIDELIAAGRYMSKEELAHIPDYEKGILAGEIYHFYYGQPETVERPYPYGADYYEAVKVIRPQLDMPDKVEGILSSMTAVLDNTADFARNYASMQKTLRDLASYRDGIYSLFTPLAEETGAKALPEPVPEQSREEALAGKLNGFIRDYDPYGYADNMEAGQDEADVIRELAAQLRNPDGIAGIYEYLEETAEAMEPDDEDFAVVTGLMEEVGSLPAMKPPYDLQARTVVYIGMDQYEIQSMSDETVILHDLTYPLFTKDFSREEFDRKLRENPANDHLKIKRPLPELPAENKKEEPEPAPDIPEPAADGIPVGTELVINGRRFSVDSVDVGHGTVSLKDITFQDGTGFPIFRSESLQFVRDRLREQEAAGREAPGPEDVQADLTPAWEKREPAGRVKSFDLHPEIPTQQRSQYRITNDELGYGTKKEKFRANIMAIQLLKKCEEEDRYATPQEQEILSGYVGWGGLSEAFDETNGSWGYEYLELKTVLTEDEYAAARQSTLTAFYTPPVVIRAMYRALEDMGLKSGNILEPSCAVGNFIGMKPDSLSDCKIYGVEIDSISGRIAQQLYQKSTIAVQGYEDANLPDSFFDVAIGNVPFGQFKVSDKRYDRHNFLIHDYFFAKTLDKVRPGGVIAFITSSGTMDKKNPAVRKYIAQRAELLGAVRLPDNTFRKNAGTEVTADILFLQKRDRFMGTPANRRFGGGRRSDGVNELSGLPGSEGYEVRDDEEPDWIYLDTDENGITQNSYFVRHPEMVLGEMVMESTQYGMDSACKAYGDSDLESQLMQAIENIHAEIEEYETDELVEEDDRTIPADPSVANFSYTLVGGQIYYRENSRMKPVELSVTGTNRVKGMIAIRDCVRTLIAYQTEGYADTVIQGQQKKLNTLYDSFAKQYGLLNARANSMVFSDDNSYPLLCSLEIVAEDGTLERKADMFTKRTIKPHQTVTKVDTASEALSLSLSERACVDMGYMCSLTDKSAEEIEQELKGVIFRIPDVAGKAEPQFVSEDEYLSGNVRQKLREARLAAQASDLYQSNVEALEKVQPKDLTASEISVRLGATWIPVDDVMDFMFQLLDTPNYARWNIKVHFAKVTGEWNIEGKSYDKGNVKANNTYGTHRANAYKIIEDTLNLRDTRVYDYIEDEEGKKKAVLNKKETAIAQGKQDLIKQAFQDWIWTDPKRRQRLTEYYNEHFNAIRPREYDGSHLNFYGMNPEITLRQHQRNGVARIIYGGNTLLAYVVGAGKTYTMAAAAMECKRLGLCNKSMIVVPNHIIEQFAAEWLQLYPSANILVSTKKDFETKNRKKFCARIATSDIDAVIIGHSQFEKIPLSVERQQRMLERQIDEIVDGIAEAKHRGGNKFTIKQMEKTKKTLESRLKKLNDQSRKDDVVNFEELGIDRLFVDEADSYKNLYLYTKMRNVGGIAQTEAQKSSDMFMKCQYLDEITGGKGVIFATGTPVSNSMVELYTMQRYLQYHTLEENHLQHFDAWASTFGEAQTAIELAPEGYNF